MLVIGGLHVGNVSQSTETAIRLRSQFGARAVVYVNSRVEEARRARDDARLTYWLDVAHCQQMLDDPPPTINPGDILSEVEFGRLALTLLGELAVSSPALAERMAAACHDVDLKRDISGGEAAFKDGDNCGRVLVSGRETGGLYSLMEYAVAGRVRRERDEAPGYGPHRHHDIEESFLVQSGRLQFLLDEQILELGRGSDFLCHVPPGTRGMAVNANVSGETVELLVSFHPGGF